MDLFTVSFFGHRIVPEFWKAEARVESLIHTLLLEKEYVEFLVGRNGDFDQIVSSAVKRQQRRVRDDNSALILVLPYPTAELRDNLENFEAYYDIKVKREVLKLAQLMLGLFCCSKTISYQ